MKTLHALLLSVFCCVANVADAAPPLVNASPVSTNKITLAFSGIKEKPEALSIQFGAENAINIGAPSGGGGGGGKASIQDLVITRRVDALSPGLLNSLLTGKHFDEVIIIQGGLKIECQMVIVANFRIDAESGSDGYQVETITLKVGLAKVTVAP